MTRLFAIAALAAVALAAGTISSEKNGQAATAAADSLSGTISVEYSATNTFDTTEDATIWWNRVKRQFEKAYPKAKLRLIPIQGGDADLQNKIVFDFRGRQTAPDVAQFGFTILGGLEAANELLPLDKFAKSAPFTKDFSPVARAEGTYQGHLYGISLGGNDSSLLYNKSVLANAGIALPFLPKTWADVLTAARAIKAKVPNVVPFWTGAGTAVGTLIVARGPASLLYSSSTPVIFDSKTRKYVVDSPGLRELFGFYKTIWSEGLGPPASAVFDKTATRYPVAGLSKGTLGIAMGTNWWPGGWAQKSFDNYWPTASRDAGIAPIPTVKGQKPGYGNMWTGFGYVVSKYSQHPQLAWGLIKIMETRQNEIAIANQGGFVPPSVKLANDPAYLNFAPPFQAKFGQYLKYATALPTDSNYTVWSQGMQEATGLFPQNPGTSVDAAIKMLRDTVVNQIGAVNVESLKSSR